MGAAEVKELRRAYEGRKVIALAEHSGLFARIKEQAETGLAMTLGGTFEDIYASIVALCDRADRIIGRKALAAEIAELREKRDAATADQDAWHRLNDRLTDAQGRLLALDARPWDLQA